jgi:8-oxo-dGTP pyrophosphatase MutT (NUDIX family)
VAAGILFLRDRQVLMVRPTYKGFWDLPGGYVEVGESPRGAAAREVWEELGIKVKPGALLVVDWAPTESEGDKILFLFLGPRFSEDVRFSLSTDEVAEARYVGENELDTLTIPRLARRIRCAIAAHIAGHADYLEHGEVVAPA